MAQSPRDHSQWMEEVDESGDAEEHGSLVEDDRHHNGGEPVGELASRRHVVLSANQDAGEANVPRFAFMSHCLAVCACAHACVYVCMCACETLYPLHRGRLQMHVLRSLATLLPC